MEWRFGVTASSNEVQRVGSSFLQLRLLINKGNAKEEVFMGECGCVLQFYFGFSVLLVGGVLLTFGHHSPPYRTDSATILFISARNGESQSQLGIFKLNIFMLTIFICTTDSMWSVIA